jgi:hypothetical protein
VRRGVPSLSRFTISNAVQASDVIGLPSTTNAPRFHDQGKHRSFSPWEKSYPGIAT